MVACKGKVREVHKPGSLCLPRVMVLLVILGCCEAPHVRVGYSLEAGQRCCDRVFEVWHEPRDPCGVYLDDLLEFSSALFRGALGNRVLG